MEQLILLKKLLEKSLEHDHRLDSLEEKLGELPTRQEIFTRLDAMVKTLATLDQERIFTLQWLKRVDGEVVKVKQQVDTLVV